MLFANDVFGGNGRGFVNGEVCLNKARWGRIQGNTFHSHGRFGTYSLGYNFPKRTDQSIVTNGRMLDKTTCNAVNADGSDNGVGVVIADNFDYGNVFVGHYEAGDIQYLRHTSIANNNLIYWKETKNFQDGCSAHLSGSYYSKGTMALPDQAAYIIEDTTFAENVLLEANHHCNVGTAARNAKHRSSNSKTRVRWLFYVLRNVFFRRP